MRIKLILVQLIALSTLLFSLQICKAQNMDLQIKYGSKYDSCKSKPILPILKTSDQIYTNGNISYENFQKLNKVALLSPCLLHEFSVIGFRMVGMVENKDPIIVTIKGNEITDEDILKFKSLGNSFQLFIEDIRSRNARATDKSYLRFNVK